MNEDEIKKLYNALIQKGYSTSDIGEEDVFISKMGDKENRRQLYEHVSARGNFRIGDYGTYERRLTGTPAPLQDDRRRAATLPEWQRDGVPETPPSASSRIRREETAERKGTPMTEVDGMWLKSGIDRTMAQAESSRKQGENRMAFAQGNAGLDTKPVRLGENRRVVETPGGTFLTASGNEHVRRGLADFEQRRAEEAEKARLAEEQRKREEEERMRHDPTLWETATKSLGAGFMRAGAGLVDAMQALTSGLYVEDPSSPTGWTRTRSYEEALADPRDPLTLATSSMHGTADRMSREAQPQGGSKGFLDLLWDGDIGGFLQKGVATAGESLPMTLSAFNPATMVLNAVSMAGSNFRENTLADPDIPAWKRAAQAIGSAAIEQAVEKYADPVFKHIGGMKVLGGGAKDAAEKVSTEVTKDATETLAGRIYGRLKGLGKDAVGEGAEEVISNAGNDILGETLDLVDGNEDYGLRAQWEETKKENPEADLWDFARAKAKENVESFLGGAMAGAYTSGTAQLSAKALQYSFDRLGGGSVEGNEGQPLNPLNVDVAQAYDEGYSEEETEGMQDAKNLYELRRGRMAETLGVDAGQVDEAIGDPVNFAGELQRLGRNEEVQPVLDYVNAKARYDGMIQRVRDDIDGRIGQSNQMVDERTNHETGLVQGVTMKAQDENHDDRRAYLLSGNLAMLPDGTGIDHENSSGSVLLRYGDTGEMEMASPEAVLSMDESAVDPEVEKQTAAEAIRRQFASEAAARIDGTVAFQPGDTYTVTDENGQASQLQVVPDKDGVVDKGDGTVNVSSDGGQTVVAMRKEDIQAMVDATNRARVAQAEQQRADAVRATQGSQTMLPEYKLNYGVTVVDGDGNTLNGTIQAVSEGDNYVLIDEIGPGGFARPIPIEQFENGVQSMSDEYGNVIWERRQSQENAATSPGGNILDSGGKSLPLQGETNVRGDVTVSEPVPQGEHRTEASQDQRMAEAAAGLRDRIEAAAGDAQAAGGTLSGGQQQEIEQRAAESYAKENGLWIPMSDTFAWHPMPSGNENNVYLNTDDGHVYKVNNLMHSKGVLPLFERVELHNQIFPESKYEFVGFTGFDRGSVYPVFRQEYVTGGEPATPEEIGGYMQSLGFHRTGDAEYSNGTFTVSDLRPRNVLKDADGDLYVIDADFRMTETGNNGGENIPQNGNIEPQNIPASTETLQADGETLQENLQAGTDGASALERIPKDEQGQPLYEQADPETAWDAIVEQTEGDEAMAQSVADSMVADKEAELKKIEKVKPKTGTTIAEKIAAERERKNAVEQAKANLALWQKIAHTSQRRKQAALAEQSKAAEEAARLRRAEEEKLRAEREEAERIRREALNGVPDFVEDTPQDARARGFRRVSGNKVDRQQAIPTRQGNEVQVKFDDNNIPTGHIALIDASQLQPSHINGQRNPLHFIDEAQPKERNDEASVMSARKIAANIRPEEITSSVTAYTGAPTVNTRGEVIQGNNRSAALREMWAAHPEQAARYRQYLTDHAGDFGLAPEDVEAMQQPVLVNMLDVSDDDAITLGQFVAQDTESGGTERIKPRNIVQKMGGDMRSFAGQLLASPDEEMSFAELIDRNGLGVLKWMQQKGYITPTQYKSAFDSKGNLTAEAKNDLKGVMYQSIFQNGNTHLEEMFNTLPSKAQKAILATAYRDYDSPNAERMNAEIQNSISAYYALSQDPAFAGAKNYKEARIAAESWKRQLAFDDVTGESYLPAEKYSNFALLLATMYKGQTQTFIQNTFKNIFDLVQGTQETTLFDEPDNTPRTLVEAVVETLNGLSDELLLNGNFIYNGQRRNNVLAGGSAAGQQGRQGSDGSTQAGERGENSARTDDGSGRTGISGNERGGEIRSGELDNNGRIEERRKKIVSHLGEKYSLSGEVSYNGEAFYQDRHGSTNLANIPDEIFDRLGITPVPFKLTETMAWHVYDHHAKELKLQNIDDAIDFILSIINNVDTVRLGRGSTYIFSIENGRNKLGRRAVSIIVNSQTGDFMGIKTAGYENIKSIKERPLLWMRGTLAAPEDVATSPITTIEPQQDDERTGRTKGQSMVSSEGKDSKKTTIISDLGEKVAKAEEETDTSPTEAQKEAGNYKKGHVRIGQFDITVENPKGSVRRGVDASGKAWEQTMRNTYGYIRGTEGVDGDHIDVFLTNDMDGWDGRRVYIVDQYNEDGTFDEHKVMLGFNDEADAQDAYLSNYEKGWSFKRKLVLSSVNLPDFEKWINSSHRKTKPFAEYKSVNKANVANEPNAPETGFEIAPAQYTTKRGKVLDMFLVTFAEPLSKEQQRAARELAKAEKGWYDRDKGGFMMRSEESARKLAYTITGNEEVLSDAQPLSLADTRKLEEPVMRQVDVEGLMQAIQENGEAKLSDHFVPQLEQKEETSARKEETSVQETESSEQNEENAYGANNKLVSRDRYEELKARMRRKLGGQLNMGIDPEILAIGTEMAAYHIEAGARKFADYATHMIADLGDAIRPYLKSFYNGARDLPEVQEAGLANEMTPYDEVRTFDVANFDKGHSDALATAEMVVQEQEADRQAEEAKEKLTERRNSQRKEKKSRKKSVSSQTQVADLFGGLFEENASTETAASQGNELNRKFAMTVKDDMLASLDNGTKPYRSILDLRKRASGIGMEVDNDGRTDILLQELVEDGLVRTAREVAERYCSDSKETYNLICKL